VSSPIVHLRSADQARSIKRLDWSIAEEQGTLGPGTRENEGSPIVHIGSTRSGYKSIPVSVIYLLAKQT